MIRGLTDRPRLPRLGKIRLGEKATSRGGKQYPSALDHFNFRDCPELEEIFGAECREIYPVWLPVDDEDTYFPTSLSAYSKSGLFCRCSDGETAIRVNKGLDDSKKPLDPQGWNFIEGQGLTVKVGDMFEMPCPGQECDYYARKLCKNLGRLFVLIPDSPRFGVYEISTTSVNSILNVLSTARAIRAAAGRLMGIPLALKLSPMQVQPEGKAKTVYVLELEYRDGGVRKLMQTASKPVAQLTTGEPEADLDEVPDDLYPHAGGDLSRALGEGDEPTSDDEPPHPADDPKAAERREQTRQSILAHEARQRGTQHEPQPKPKGNGEQPNFMDF